MQNKTTMKVSQYVGIDYYAFEKMKDIKLTPEELKTSLLVNAVLSA